MMNMKKTFAGIMAFCIISGVMSSADMTTNHAIIIANAEDMTNELIQDEYAVDAEILENATDILNVAPSIDYVIDIVDETTVAATTQTTATTETTTTTVMTIPEVQAELTYKTYNNYVEITGCNKDITEMVIPAEIEGLPVTKIGTRAFESCSNLTSITIPDFITSIGFAAFEDCSNLISVTISDSVTNIGGSAFSDTPWLEEKQNENPLVIVNNILIDGRKCTGDVIIPDGVISIIDSAFYESNITSVIIPNSVTSIGNSAFSFCDKLKSVTLSNSITSISVNMFYRCYHLESVTIPDGVTEIKMDAFRECYDLKSVTIPDSVKEINDLSFYYCRSLSSITIPDSVTSIGNSVFSNCSGLTSVTFSNNLTNIEESTFSNCSKLENINIPDSIEKIGKWAFSGCSSLTSVTVPCSVTSIDEYAFKECSNLIEITIENPVCEIYDSDSTISNGSENDGSYFNGTIHGYDNSMAQEYAEKYGYEFESMGTFIIEADFTYEVHDDYVEITSCNKDATVAVIPAEIERLPVTKISECAFKDCSSLESVTISDSVTSIAGSAFKGCSSLMDVTIPDSVTYIGYEAFYSCSSLESVTITNGITFINGSVFQNCSALKSVIIPDSVKNISSFAFAGCSSLESITIPDSVTEIGQNTFSNCLRLTDITIENPVCEIYDYAGTISNGSDENDEYYFNGTIHGYNGSFAQKYADKYNYKFDSVGESFVTYEDLTYEMHVDYVKITGCNETATKIVIPNEIDGLPVIAINEGAFLDCSHLVSITIPENVIEISGDFCDGCTALEEINVNEKNSVYYSYDGVLYEYAYQESSYYGEDDKPTYNTLLICPMGKQDEYTIKDGTEKIASYAFNGCAGLTVVNIPESVIEIGKSAFSDCSSLISITIPKNVTEISESFCDGCTALEEINVDEKNTVYYSRDDVLYKNMEVLEYNTDAVTGPYSPEIKICKTLFVCPEGKKGSYTVEDGTDRINDYAFSGCSDVTSINIPASVTYIGTCFCDGCIALEEINVDEENTVYYSYDGLLYKNQEINAYNYDISTDSYLYESAIYKSLLVCPVGKQGSCTVKDGTERIGGCAFEGCTGITAINIPASVIYVGYFFCDGCTSLTEINVDEENTVYYSYDGVLYKNNEVREYYYDTDTNSYSYEMKTYKKLLVCPMGKQGSCTVKGGTEIIGRYSFTGCAKLESINIPESVTYISNYFCAGCTSLTEINVDEENPVYYSYDGGLYKNHKAYEYNSDTDSHEPIIYKTFLVCPEGKKGKYTIKDGTDCIRAGAFEDCVSLESVSIPESVITIGGEQATISNGHEDFISEYGYSYPINYYFNGTIYGYENSTSQMYAECWRYNFVDINSAENTTTTKHIKFGDVNGDEIVDAVDATAVLVEYANLSTSGNGTFSSEQKSVGDVNLDNMIDAVDASMIMAFYAYLSTGGTETDMSKWILL